MLIKIRSPPKWVLSKPYVLIRILMRSYIYVGTVLFYRSIINLKNGDQS